jgi:hypothetical protein
MCKDPSQKTNIVHKQCLKIVVVLELSTMMVRFRRLIAWNVAILSTIEYKVIWNIENAKKLISNQMQRTTLNNLEDDEHEFRRYVVGRKWNNYGIKQRPNFHTHTQNSLSEYWQGDLSNVNDNNEWYNSWYNPILHEYWWNVK